MVCVAAQLKAQPPLATPVSFPLFLQAVDVVTDGVQAVAHVVGAGDAVRSTLDAVDQGARTVTNNVGHAADAVSSVATTVIDGQQQVVSTAAEGAQQVVSEVMQGDLAGAAEAVGSAVTNTAESAANMVSSSNGALLDAGNGWVENTFRENMQVRLWLSLPCLTVCFGSCRLPAQQQLFVVSHPPRHGRPMRLSCFPFTPCSIAALQRACACCNPSCALRVRIDSCCFLPRVSAACHSLEGL